MDAIADAVEDDDTSGPTLDPFSHKLVRRVMTDYLDRIAAAKADIARFKGEKEIFEAQNAPDDEEEETDWNYAKELEKRIRELKVENRDALKELAKLERATAKSRATPGDQKTFLAAREKLQPMLDQIAVIEDELKPYETIKQQLAEARARYRELTDSFVRELEARCDAMNEKQKRALVMELLAQDVQAGLDAAATEKRQELIRYLESLWNKYAIPFGKLNQQRDQVSTKLTDAFKNLGYVR